MRYAARIINVDKGIYGWLGPYNNWEVQFGSEWATLTTYGHPVAMSKKAALELLSQVQVRVNVEVKFEVLRFPAARVIARLDDGKETHKRYAFALKPVVAQQIKEKMDEQKVEMAKLLESVRNKP